MPFLDDHEHIQVYLSTDWQSAQSSDVRAIYVQIIYWLSSANSRRPSSLATQEIIYFESEGDAFIPWS